MDSQSRRPVVKNLITRVCMSTGTKRERWKSMCFPSPPAPVYRWYSISTQTCPLTAKTGAKKTKRRGEITKPSLSIYQTVKTKYVYAVGYCTYRLNDYSSCYDDSESSSIPKNMKKLQSQLSTQTFHPANPSLAQTFFTIFKLVCDACRIHKVTAMWATIHLVVNCIAFSLNSRIWMSDGTKGLATTVHSNCTVKIFAINFAIYKADPLIFWYIKLASITSLQYDEALISETIRVGNFINEGTLEDTLI